MAAAIAMAATAGVAQAHQFECIKTVNGVTDYTITSYPTTLHWRLEAKNTHPDATSVALELEDPFLESLGFQFIPAPPVAVPVGHSAVYTFDEVIHSARECRYLANHDGHRDANIDNFFTVVWDLGEDTCSARVECKPETPPPPPSGPTRTLGYYKTHPAALTACLASGGINLGPAFGTIFHVEQAEGLLWASPARYDDGTRRTDLARDLFLLARQYLTAVCNVRVFGATAPDNLLGNAFTALNGESCSTILSLEAQLDAFNNSGDSLSGPSFGPADVSLAKQLADGNDPSHVITDTCGGITLNSNQ